jgi:hypothetical protein
MLVDTNLVTPFSELYGCWRVADNVFRRARSLISSMEMQEILRFGWVGWGETGRGGEEHLTWAASMHCPGRGLSPPSLIIATAPATW